MDLDRASREELIEFIGHLFSQIRRWKPESPEWKVSRSPPGEGVKERKPPSWAKANRPDRPKQERKKRAHGFARRREEPTHRVEHARASCPTAGYPCRAGGCATPPDYIHTPGAGAGGRSMWCWNAPAQVPAAVVPRTGLERPGGRAATGGNLGAAGSMRAPGGVPASLWGDSTLPEVRYRLGLSVGELAALVRGAAGRGQEEYNRLQREIRASPVVYGGRDGLAGRWPQRVSLEFQHSGSALLPPPGQPGQQCGCGGVGR